MAHVNNRQGRQSLNRQYSAMKGASAINDVAVGFGKGWVVFAILSTLASAFSFYQDFYKSLGVVATVLIVIILAIALEAFKHLSIRGMFSSMNFVSKGLISAIAIALISVSFYTHYKSIQTFQKNLVGDDLKKEIAYQRDLQKVQNGQIDTILASNTEFAKALNNGTDKDDIASTASVESNNKLIETLQKISAANNMNNTNLVLEQSRSTANTTSAAILVIFIMIEIMALFSILSKIIVIDNVSGLVKDFVNVMDRLDELEDKTYESLSTNKIEQTGEKLKALQAKQQDEHKQQMALIGSYSTSTGSSSTPLPSFPFTPEEKGELWSNASCNYPTLPTGYTKVQGVDNSNIFFKGTADNFTDAYTQDGFEVEKYPIVPRKPKRTRIVKELGEFKIIEDVSRDTEEKSEPESEKVNNYGFDGDFISAEEWAELSDHGKALALSYIDLSLFDAVEEVPMIQIAFENGLINTYDEPLLKKTEVVTAYKKMRGGTLQDARDVYVRVMEKLEKQDKIVRRSRYHNRCQGINVGKVTVG